VGQFKHFFIAHEADGMVPDDHASALNGKTNRSPFAGAVFALVWVMVAALEALQRLPPPFGGSLAEHKGCPGRGVFLMAVMNFHYFNVIAFVQKMRGFFDEAG
jgi:hypothetical protein